MSKVFRSNIYASDESGPEWFNEFLRSLSKESTNDATQEILQAINNNQVGTVAGVVEGYRLSVGLDRVNEIEKEASVHRALSSRDEPRPIGELIDENQAVKSELESLLMHSGGTKKITALISFLRANMPDVIIRYSDPILKEYLTKLRDKYRVNMDKTPYESGLVGTEDIDADAADHMADFMNYDGTAK